jgi:hypothetical protein
MWTEILLVILGTFLGAILSVGTIYVTRALDKKGKVKFYGKIVYSGFNDDTWGFHNGSFHLPLWLEVQNTSNAVRIVRDVSILLFYNGKEIASMVQCEKVGANKIHGEIVFGEDGAYSFVLTPESIKRYKCYFIQKKENIKGQAAFDEIKLRYFDENDRIHILAFKKIENCWVEGNLPRDEKWQLISTNTVARAY